MKILLKRFTILPAGSSTGEKLKALEIVKGRKLKYFKYINIKNLTFLWQRNKKVWITSSIFTEWATQLNKQTKQRKKNTLLFIDNCPAHSSVLLFLNVKLQFLPSNTTLYIQPLDQGIIQV